MGLRKQLAVLLVAASMAIGLFGSAPALAYTVELREVTCAGGAPTAEQAFDLPLESLRCSGERFYWPDRFVRTATRLEGRVLPLDSGLYWQTEAADFSSMLVRFTYADGSRRLVDVDPQMTARNWFAGNRFSVPIPAADAPLVAVDTVVEQPFARSVMSKARVVTEGDRDRHHYRRSLAYMLVLGLLILPLLYDLLFYRVLRQDFVLWHLGLVAATSLYMLLQSGIVHEIASDLPLSVRWNGIGLSLAVATLSAAMMVRGLIEDRFLPKRMTAAMLWVAFLPLAVKLVGVIARDALRIRINDWFEYSFLPVVVMFCGVSAVALAKGSRGARWALLGMASLVLIMAVRMIAALGLMQLSLSTEDLVFVGFVFLSLVTAFAVGDRFSLLKQDHDAAQITAVKLGQMANTDGLTGLANRRAFDQIARLQTGKALLLADVDRFKRVNDRQGHQVGDAVLCHTASVLRGALMERPGARVFRIGGEEFAIVLDALEGHEVMAVAELVRQRVAQQEPNSEEFDLPPVTLSVGAALGHGQLMHEAFADADHALYRAKREGRNCSRLSNAESATHKGGRSFAARLGRA